MMANQSELENALQSIGQADELSQADMERVEKALLEDKAVSVPEHLLTEPEKAAETAGAQGAEIAAAAQEGNEDIRLTISKATLPQKIKLAMFGNSTCRAILIRDSNRMIQEFVLKNPRMQLPEIEEFGRNPNMAQNVLRIIANNQGWMKSYQLKSSLVQNPKTPGDIALKWLKHLNMNDVKRLAKSKNIPQVVAMMAKKKVNDAERKGHG